MKKPVYKLHAHRITKSKGGFYMSAVYLSATNAKGVVTSVAMRSDYNETKEYAEFFRDETLELIQGLLKCKTIEVVID